MQEALTKVVRLQDLVLDEEDDGEREGEYDLHALHEKVVPYFHQDLIRVSTRRQLI